jgi:hypothetical protein
MFLVLAATRRLVLGDVLAMASTVTLLRHASS